MTPRLGLGPRLVKSGWKGYQKSIKGQRLLQKGVLAVVLLALIGLTVGVFRFYLQLKKPLPQLSATQLPPPNRGRGEQMHLVLASFDNEGKLTVSILVYKPQITIAEGVIQKSAIFLLDLPIDLPLLTSAGEIKLDQAWLTAKALNPPQGFEFVMEVLQDHFQVPIDGYVVKSRKSKVKIQKYFQLSTLWELLILNGGENFYTNLKKTQLAIFWWDLSKVREDRVYQLELQKANLLEVFRDEKIVDEGLKVSILNKSQLSGLARQAAPWVENLGSEVLIVGNVSEQEVCRVMSKDCQTEIRAVDVDKPSATLKRLEEIFDTPAVRENGSQKMRADIEIKVAHLPKKAR